MSICKLSKQDDRELSLSGCRAKYRSNRSSKQLAVGLGNVNEDWHLRSDAGQRVIRIQGFNWARVLLNMICECVRVCVPPRNGKAEAQRFHIGVITAWMGFGRRWHSF